MSPKAFNRYCIGAVEALLTFANLEKFLAGAYLFNFPAKISTYFPSPHSKTSMICFPSKFCEIHIPMTFERFGRFPRLMDKEGLKVTRMRIFVGSDVEFSIISL
jgi:hypothetical protein